MKKSGLLKSLVVVLLSGVLVANLATFVFADDDFTSEWGQLTDNTSNSTNNTVDNNSLNENANNSSLNDLNSNSNNVNTNYQSSGNLGTNLNTTNNSLNGTNDDKNELAYTGIAENNILPVMIVLGVIVTAYSFKKIKEYNI